MNPLITDMYPSAKPTMIHTTLYRQYLRKALMRVSNEPGVVRKARNGGTANAANHEPRKLK